MACVVAVGLPATGDEPEDATFRVVGKLDRLWPRSPERDTSGCLAFDWACDDLIIDAKARRAYILYGLRDASTNFKSLGMRSYDLDTFEPLRYAEFNQGSVETEFFNIVRQELFYALDPDHRRLYLPGLIIDLAAFDQGEESFRTNWGQDFIGAHYFIHPSSGRSKLLLSTPKLHHGTPPTIVQYDLEGNTPLLNWEVSVADCTPPRVPSTGDVMHAVWRSLADSAIYFWCMGANTLIKIPVVEATPEGPLEDVLPSDAPTSEDIPGTATERFPGPEGRGNYQIADPGGDRLIVAGRGGLWVFDGRAERWVGVVNMSIPIAVDPHGGRSYALGGNLRDPVSGLWTMFGFQVLDHRLTPVPQTLRFLPELTYTAAKRPRIEPATDGRPTRIFLRRGYGRTEYGNAPGCQQNTEPAPELCPAEDHWIVIEDRLPPGRDPVLLDLDANTANVEEKEGLTTASFNAEGSGYGSRLFLVGGLDGAARRPGRGTDQEPVDSAYTPDGSVRRATGPVPACWSTDRDLMGARVEAARLSDFQASASSHAMWANASTIEDLSKPGTRCQLELIEKFGLQDHSRAQDIDQATQQDWAGTEDDIGRDWNFRPVECVGDSQAATGDQDHPTPKILGSGSNWPDAHRAHATCAQSEHSVVAGAQTHPLGLSAGTPAVSVGSSATTVSLTRDEDGIHVEVVAEARGIRLASATQSASIALVRTVTRSHAGGRPKTASTEFVRTFCGVGISQNDAQTHSGACTSDPAQIRQMVDGLNAAFRGEILVRAPDPDADWATGTPGGYAAGVLRDTYDALDAQLLHRDRSQEVPGLEVISLNQSENGPTRRVIVQLAGARAVSTYGIQVLPQFEDFLAPLPDELGDLLGDLSSPGLDDRLGEFVSPPPAADDPPPAPTEPLPPALGPAQPAAVPVGGPLVRSVREGLLTSAVWFAIGLPFYLASRRRAFLRAVMGRGGEF